LYFMKAPHATASPSIECTARARWTQTALGAVCPHHGWGHTLGQPNRHRLALVGLLARPGCLPHHCIGSIAKYEWALQLFCLNMSSRRHILLFSVFVPAKHIHTKTCGNVSRKTLFLSFGGHIFFILFKCWWYKCVLRTANSKLVLAAIARTKGELPT
jgi:hypothetical protein